MKTIRKAAFPLLLILACTAVHFWHHALVSLPYLPNNEIVPLCVLTPALLALTFSATFVLLRQNKTSKPVLRSVLSTGAMLLPILAAGTFFLSYLAYRFAAPLSVLRLPDWPVGICIMVVTAVCLVHLTALLVCGFVMRKTEIKHVIPAAVGWLLLNACLFLITI